MVTFIAVYRGSSIDSANVIAVSEEVEIVQLVAETLLARKSHAIPTDDPVLKKINDSLCEALATIVSETQHYV